MAFYLVTDGKKNVYGEADTYLVRARGRRQAKKLAILIDEKNATVEKLEDGRSVENGVILASLVDYAEPEPSEPDYAF